MLLQTLELLTHSDNMALPRLLYDNIVEFYVRGLEKYQVIKKGNTSYRVEVVSDIPRDSNSGKYNLIREEFGSA